MIRSLPLFLMLVACGAETVETTTPAPAVEVPADNPEEQPAQEEAQKETTLKVSFVNLKDGDTVTSPFNIEMGVEGMKVQAAGQVVEGTGHHHIIIGPVGIEKGVAVPKDETHIHFGKGQTKAQLELVPGTHKLTLQFADGNHSSYGEVGATTITINVEK